MRNEVCEEFEPAMFVMINELINSNGSSSVQKEVHLISISVPVLTLSHWSSMSMWKVGRPDKKSISYRIVAGRNPQYS